MNFSPIDGIEGISSRLFLSGYSTLHPFFAF